MPSSDISGKEFWEAQARACGEAVEAVNFDPLSDDFPGAVFAELVGDGLAVADVGCGNGRNLLELAGSRPAGTFVGYDFSETFVRVAEERAQRLGLENIRFECLDAAAPDLPSNARGAYDVVIGKRLLINIMGEAKLVALKNIHALLKPGGTYIMSECFMEPLSRVNHIRRDLGLSEITVKPFNEYLTQDFMSAVDRLFTIEQILDIDSLYYFISRIFNAYLSDGPPDYHAPINRLAAQLVQLGHRPMTGFTPEYIHVLRARPDATAC